MAINPTWGATLYVSFIYFTRKNIIHLYHMSMPLKSYIILCVCVYITFDEGFQIVLLIVVIMLDLNVNTLGNTAS